MAWSSSTSKLYASSGDIFSQRKSKAHIAMDIFYSYKKDTDKRKRASCFEPSSSDDSPLSHILICFFCRSVS